MEFAWDEASQDWQRRLRSFMDDHIYPVEAEFAAQSEQLARTDTWGPPAVLAGLRELAKAAGLWNLFLPGRLGAGLTNLQYAPLAEITGHSPMIAPAALNCAAPDTGNMELLAEFGTREQQRRWLEPLLAGEIRSAFAMTEPAVASSDATNITTSIVRDGDEYIVNGRKWYISGAMAPQCELLIVLGVSDPDGERHRRQSMILVPRDTPGVTLVRSTGVYGYDDGPHGGHAEILFDDARV